MDLDVIAKHMPGLLEFKKRVEALLEAADAGSGSATEALSNQVTDLRSALGKIGDDVAALQVLRSGDDKKLTDIGEQVSALQVSKEEAESFSERLTTMLDWFEANRDGLEVLLSIGDDMAAPKPAPDQPTPQPDPAPVPEPVAEPAAETKALDPAPTSADPDPAPADAPQLEPAAAPVVDAAAPAAPAAADQPAATATDQPVT